MMENLMKKLIIAFGIAMFIFIALLFINYPLLCNGYVVVVIITGSIGLAGWF